MLVPVIVSILLPHILSLIPLSLVSPPPPSTGHHRETTPEISPPSSVLCASLLHIIYYHNINPSTHNAHHHRGHPLHPLHSPTNTNLPTLSSHTSKPIVLPNLGSGVIFPSLPPSHPSHSPSTSTCATSVPMEVPAPRRAGLRGSSPLHGKTPQSNPHTKQLALSSHLAPSIVHTT